MPKIDKQIFAVFGLGVFGQTIASVLAQKGGEVIVVDHRPEVIESFKNKVTTALLIDSTDEKALAKAPIDDVDVAIVTVGDDIETNIITTALLKQRGIPYIVSRAISNIHTQILLQVGANEVVNLQKDGGKSLANRLIAPEILSKVQISSEYSFSEMYIPESFIGQSVSDMGLLNKFSLHLCAIKRLETKIDTAGTSIQKDSIIFPNSNEILQNRDILMVIGRNDHIEEFKKLI